MGEVSEIDKAKEKFIKKNGDLKGFSVKEIVVMNHEETKNEIKKVHKRLDDVKKTLKQHMTTSQKILTDHDILFEKMMNTLPEKGFCENVTNTLWSKNEPPLSTKVNELWHQRKYIKGIFVTLIAIFGVEIMRFLYA
jgi:hypothetical protein